MPTKSKKQEKFMQAVANNPKFAKKVGVKQSIGREFTKEKEMKKVKKMQMGGRAMTDREGRAMATGRYANDPRLMADARGRAMMKKGGEVKKMENGGKVKKPGPFEIMLEDGTIIDNPNIGGPSQFFDSDEKRAATRKANIKRSRELLEAKAKRKRMEKKHGKPEFGQIMLEDGTIIDNPNIGGPSQFFDSDEKRDATYKERVKRGREKAADRDRNKGLKAGGKVKKMRHGGNTSRTNELEELGRVDAERGYSPGGRRNLRDEKARVVREIKGKAAGGIIKPAVKVAKKLAGKIGRALAKDKKGMTKAQLKDAGGRAMKKGGMVRSSASKRADGIAQKGHTRGRIV